MSTPLSICQRSLFSTHMSWGDPSTLDLRTRGVNICQASKQSRDLPEPSFSFDKK